MSIPVVIAQSGLGMPVRQIESGAPVMQVASNGLGMPIVLSDLGAPFVVLGAAPDPVAPSLQSAPSISPTSGQTGTAFTVTRASFSGTEPITVSGVLRQAGVDVTAQMDGNSFTSTAAGALEWSETATNSAGSSGPHVATATVTQPPQISDFYGTGAGQVPLRLKSSDAVMSGANVQNIPNAGGAGSIFDLIAGTAAITRTGDNLALDLTPEEWLRFSNAPTASAPDLMNTTVFIVAGVTLGGVDQYFMGNGSPQANVWLISSGTQMRFSRRNPTTNSVETVTVPLVPGIAAGNRAYEIEFTPGTPSTNGQTAGGEVRVRVNGELRGSAPHTYPDFRVWNFSAGQNPVSGNGLRALVYDTLSIIRGGDHDARVAQIRERLNTLYGLGM